MSGGRSQPSPHVRGVALLVLLVLLAYLSSTRGGFVWDDVVLATGRRTAPQGKAAGVFLGYWSQHRGAFTPGYYPARELSLALDRKLWGQNAPGFHVTNVALHILSCVLLYALALKVTGRPGTSLLWAALWGLHPAATECADWIKNRTILLCAPFSFGALILAFPGLDVSRSRRVLFAVACGCCYALALLCKELAMVVPAIALLLPAVVPRLKGQARRAPVLAMWLVLGVYLAAKGSLFAFGHERILPARRRARAPAAERVWRSCVTYASVAGAPVRLCAERGLERPRHVWGLVLLGCAMALAWRRGRPQWLAALGVGWFVLAIAPAANWPIYLADRPIAEQRAYLALPGACAVVCALGRGRRSWTVACLLVPLVALTVHRHSAWASNRALWTATLPEAPAHPRAWLNLGNVYLDESRPAAAERCHRRSIRLDPLWASPWHQLAEARVLRKDWSAAARFYERSLTLSRRPDVHFALAGCYANLGQYAAAAAQCLLALEVAPEFTDALVRLALIQIARGQEQDGVATLERAAQEDPGNAWAQFELGNHHYKHKRWRAALRHYEATVDLGGESDALLLNMGIALRFVGRAEDAERCLERCVTANSGQWRAWEALGMLAESAGRFHDARFFYLRAMAIHPQAGVARRRLPGVLRELAEPEP